MKLLEAIAMWQQEAVNIEPPSNSDRLRAVGGLPGPAFFPEGFGLSHDFDPQNGRPTLMAIGHNFGGETYRRNLEPPGPGREDIDGRRTWCKLDVLLRKVNHPNSRPSNCYRTNWFIGLLPGDKQNGAFLLKPDPIYENACRSLLIKQIRCLRPTAILLLGPEVARRAYQLFPALAPWRDAKDFAEIDRSSIGHSQRNVEIASANRRTNVVALLHPSQGAGNEARRMKNMTAPFAEAELIRAALEP
jgi:uracil-DNA glycosylase